MDAQCVQAAAFVAGIQVNRDVLAANEILKLAPAIVPGRERIPFVNEVGDL